MQFAMLGRLVGLLKGYGYSEAIGYWMAAGWRVELRSFKTKRN